MSDEQSYNGWSNYETWCMALWISNDEGSYNYSRGMAQEEHDRWIEEGGREALGSLADRLKDWQCESLDDTEFAGGLWSDHASVWTDLMNAAIGEIDWYEIAANLLSELSETVDQ